MMRSILAQSAYLNAEMTEQEKKEIAAQESARPEWQAKLARRIARMQSDPKGKADGL